MTGQMDDNEVDDGGDVVVGGDGGDVVDVDDHQTWTHLSRQQLDNTMTRHFGVFRGQDKSVQSHVSPPPSTLVSVQCLQLRRTIDRLNLFVSITTVLPETLEKTRWEGEAWEGGRREERKAFRN